MIRNNAIQYQQIDRENTPFIWAGARISGSKTSVFWENGRSEGIRRGQHPWSFAGLRGPQPDGAGSEDCLAILNDVYNVSKYDDDDYDDDKFFSGNTWISIDEFS